MSVVLTACSGGSGSSTSSTHATASASTPAAGSSGSAPSSAAASSKGSGSNVKPVPVETRPPGDIPDNLAFVRYVNKAGRYSFTHPEGWAQTAAGARVRFTDKLNGVSVVGLKGSAAPSIASARSSDVPRLRTSVPAFRLRDISAVTVPGGRGVRIVFRRNSAPDPVTGKVYRDEVEEYVVFSSGRLVRMDLFGPVGADNVDAYRTMSHSLRIR